MKKIFIAGIIVLGSFFSNAQSSKKPAANYDLGISVNPRYSKAGVLDSIMKRYTTHALPGAAIALYTEKEGWWAGAQGYANIENKTPMENSHLQYIQSVSKMYMAVAILQLKEQGKIDLDAPITTYLPARYSRYVRDAAKVTVRMLLNHRSGVAEYNSNPQFLSQVIQHPLDYFSADDCLKSIADKEPEFVPGSKYVYRNTNYLLLSLIGDAVTGDHAAYIQQHIFKPLHLHNTFYGIGHDYLDGLHLTDSYWDVLNTGEPANISLFQQETVASSKGDDGIVCTPADAVQFLKGLMEGRLLQPESLKEMLHFVKDEKGHNRYGMGMIYFDLEGVPAYGHGGGGIGAGCGLLYIPSRKVYLFFATNLRVLAESDLVKKADEFRNAIIATVLQ